MLYFIKEKKKMILGKFLKYNSIQYHLITILHFNIFNISNVYIKYINNI